MLYREIKPGGALSEHVQLVWMCESVDPSAFPRQRILPDGIVELVFHHGDPFLTHGSDGQTRTQLRSFAISQMRRVIEIEPSGAIGLIAARLYPWGARHFFDCPVGEFLDAAVSAEDLFGARGRDVEEQLCLATTPGARLEILQQFLRRLLATRSQGGDVADGIIRLIRDTRGQLSMQELARQTGFGQRRLERTVAAAVGTSPKHFSRVTRFLNLCSHLRAHRHKSLTRLTYDCGYYDQAHFIKEFKEFAGLTPTAFFTRHDVAFTKLD